MNKGRIKRWICNRYGHKWRSIEFQQEGHTYKWGQHCVRCGKNN